MSTSDYSAHSRQAADWEEEIRRLKAENQLFRLEHKLLGRATTLILLGPRLVTSIRAWLIKRSEGIYLPVDETAQLAAAIIRRIFAVGILGMFFASILPAILVAWQNHLIAEQNAYFRDQNEKLQIQIDQEVQESRQARRAQLLSTLYDTRDCPGDISEDCPPIAHIRARSEAVQAFVLLERGASARPLLVGLNLNGALLVHPDFEKVYLAESNLRRARFTGGNFTGSQLVNVDLENADLRFSKFVGAKFFGVTLEDSNLTNANFSFAELRADLTEARLDNAILQSADLMGAKLDRARLDFADLTNSRVKQTEIDKAHGNAFTKLPAGIERPLHWQSR